MLIIGLLAVIPPAAAQLAEQERARRLLAAGQPSLALELLDRLEPIYAVLEDRARAHLLLAGSSTGPLLCSHARMAYDYASLASNSELVAKAGTLFRDNACPRDQQHRR